MLSKLSGILRIDVGTACLHHREKHNRPEDPRQLNDFVDIERLILLHQRFAGSWIRRRAKALVCNLCKEKEEKCAQVCEERNACSDPEDPSEVSGILIHSQRPSLLLVTQRFLTLDMTLAVELPTKPPMRAIPICRPIVVPKPPPGANHPANTL